MLIRILVIALVVFNSSCLVEPRSRRSHDEGVSPTTAICVLDDTDTDQDGLCDRKDTDDDNDGVLDIHDAFPTDEHEYLDTDLDGIGDFADPDDDNDGASDEYEITCFRDSRSALSVPLDSDGDGWCDRYELSVGTDPDNKDTDMDGVADPEDYCVGDDAHCLGIGNPIAMIESGPGSGSNERTAVFVVSSQAIDVVGFECRIVPEEFAPCTSPIEYTQLRPGQYAFEVSAVDVDGNASDVPASWLWTVTGPIVLWTRELSPSYSWAQIADLEGDGRNEVIATNYYEEQSLVGVFDGQSGALKWSSPQGENIASAPAIGDLNGDGTKDVVVVGNNFGAVLAIDGMSGERLWVHDAGTRLFAAPVLVDINSNGLVDVLVASTDHKLYAFDGVTGSVIWSFATDNEIYGSPTVFDTDGNGQAQIYLGSTDRHVYCLEATTGSVNWQVEFTFQWGIRDTLSITDLEGDGNYELLVPVGRTVYAVSVSDQTVRELGGGEKPDVTRIIDIDKDGFLDISISGSDLRMLDGRTGDLRWIYNPLADIYNHAIADVDGDGHEEIIFGDMKGVLTTLDAATGVVESTFQTIHTDYTHWIYAPPTVGDIDDDGWIDVVVTTSEGTLYALSYAEFPYEPDYQASWALPYFDLHNTSAKPYPRPGTDWESE